MGGRHAAWTPGSPRLRLPVLLPSEIRSKGRIKLPQELLDKAKWLASGDGQSQDVALEIRGAGFVRIVPKDRADALLAADEELVQIAPRRLLICHIEDGQRLVLPSMLEERVFDRWTNAPPQKVVLDCHSHHVSVLTTQAWMTLIAADNDKFESLGWLDDPDGEP